MNAWARAYRRWADRGGPTEQAERTAALLFALFRGAQSLQLLVLFREPLNAGTATGVVVAVAVALSAEAAAAIALSLVRGAYGGRKMALAEVSCVVAAYVAVYAATPARGQVEASNWLFSPASAVSCCAALGLRWYELICSACILAGIYSWGSLQAPSQTSPLIFNVGAITSFPVLAMIAYVGVRHLRRTAQRLLEDEQLLAEAAATRARLEERAHQGRFLHDSVIQVLEEIQDRLGSGEAHLDLVTAARAAARQCRLYLEGKDPLAAESLAMLLAELEQHATELSVRLRVTDERPGGRWQLGTEQLAALNLAAREVVRNIRRHTTERTVTVRVTTEPGLVHVTLTRSGDGYDPTRLPDGKFEGVTRAGGSVELDTRDRSAYGERVRFTFPDEGGGHVQTGPSRDR